MKNALLILFLLSMSVTAQKLDRKAIYEYSETIEFRIYGITKQKSVDRGGGNNSNIIVADKGQRFITIVFEFKNNSDKDQDIDFEQVFLKDDSGEIHEIDFVVMSMKMTSRTNKLQQTIKGNKKRKIIAQFIPPVDKDEVIDELVINGNTIQLKYN